MRQSRLPQREPRDNGEAREAGEPADTSFDPAAFEAPNPRPSTSEVADPFNPASLRLKQDFTAALGVKEILVSVPVEKPKGEWWVRVHPSEAYSLETAVIELKEDREVYLVAPPLWPSLADEPTFSPRAIFTAITRQGRLFLWHCRLPGADGKTPDWITLPLEAVRQAKTAWTRFFWDAGQGRHRIKTAAAEWDDPAWPEQTFPQLLKLAFKDRFIQTADHPILRKLRGD